MPITKDEALERAVSLLSERMKCRLEIIESIPGPFYNSAALDPGKCWIVHVCPEKFMLDGKQQYIMVDKDTGTMMEVTAT
jgi:hypothetical protein